MLDGTAEIVQGYGRPGATHIAAYGRSQFLGEIGMRRGAGLTPIGSRFDPDTRRLLEVLARNRLVWTWLDLEASPEAEAIVRGLDLPVADLPVVIIPGGPLLRNPGGRALLDALGISGTEGPYPAGVCDLLVVGGGPATDRPRFG
jgi:thioredoxin reductase (NADPH)